MTDYSNHFPAPVDAADVPLGELFAVSFPAGLWICLRVASHDRNAALVLSSYDASERTPFRVWLQNLPSPVGRIEGKVTVRPLESGGVVPHAAGYAQPGGLSVLPDGEVFISDAARGGSPDYFSLRNGRTLHYIPDAALHYPSWEMIVTPNEGEAHKARPLARFEAPKQS